MSQSDLVIVKQSDNKKMWINREKSLVFKKQNILVVGKLHKHQLLLETKHYYKEN